MSRIMHQTHYRLQSFLEEKGINKTEIYTGETLGQNHKCNNCSKGHFVREPMQS